MDDRSNEIMAIPQLLRLLDVSGCIVTIDGMGYQTKIAQTIRDEKADYVLRLKANQGHLHQDGQDWFAYADQVNKHGNRIEIRCCWAVNDPLAFEHIQEYQGWADLQTIMRVCCKRRFVHKTQVETIYYLAVYRMMPTVSCWQHDSIGQLKTVLCPGRYVLSR